jgi:hydrogenase maturation protein HypF
LGLAYDGTGYGADGTSWGGELLLAAYDRFERLATYRPLKLAGGDLAIREPWRIALSAIDDAFAGAAPIEGLALFDRIPPRELALVRQMIAKDVNAPAAHGVGRYFDAFGAMGLGRARITYEGQAAIEWGWAADARETGGYDFGLNRDVAPWQVDLRPAIRAAARELLCGVPAALVSARVHNTIAAAAANTVRLAARIHGRLPVVLSGGCFQNARLTGSIVSDLRRDLTVYAHERVPPGDGGIALGQVVVANAIVGAG